MASRKKIKLVCDRCEWEQDEWYDSEEDAEDAIQDEHSCQCPVCGGDEFLRKMTFQ